MSDYSLDAGLERLEQIKLRNKLIASQTDVSQEQLKGQVVKNMFEKQGLSTNSPYQVKQVFLALKKSGMSSEEITSALLAAGVTSEVLKTIVPAGILGSLLKRTKSLKFGKSKPRYNSPQSWRQFE